MHLDLWLKETERSLLLLWQGLGNDGPYYVWLAAGVLGAFVWAWFSHRLIRRLLGHRKFRSTWYNAEQLEALVKMIDEDNHKGHRVIRHDEMALLREWRFGSTKGTVFERGSGYL